MLIDESTGRVLRAGCVRLPATSESNESSTKSEGRAMLEALRDVLPGIPPGWGLYESTDSASWVESFEHGSKLKLRRRVRKPDTGPMQAVRAELTTAAGRGIDLKYWARAGSRQSTTYPQVTTAGGTCEARRTGRPTRARAAAPRRGVTTSCASSRRTARRLTRMRPTSRMEARQSQATSECVPYTPLACAPPCGWR